MIRTEKTSIQIQITATALFTVTSPASTSSPFLAPSLIRILPSDNFSIITTITGSMIGVTIDLYIVIKSCDMGLRIRRVVRRILHV